jgi:hypothetical protein
MFLIIIALASPQADTGPLTDMTEDSGAFKTISEVSRRVPGFVMFRQRPLQRSLTVVRTADRRIADPPSRQFFTSAARALRYLGTI